MAVLRSTSSATSASASFSCPKPSGTQQGDILIAFQTCSDFGNGNMTTPTGGSPWQLLGQRDDTEWAGTRVWWKRVGASEPAAYTFRQSGNNDSIAAIAAVADAGTATPLIASTENGADASVSCPSVSSSLSPGVTLRWAAGLRFSFVGWSAPSGYSEHLDRWLSAGATASLASRPRTATGATGAVAFTASSAPIFSHGFTVDVGGTAVPPAPPPPAIPPSKDIHYRYVFCDLLTDDYITDLDLSDVSYDRRIGEPGSFSGSISIPSNDPNLAEKVAAVVPRYPGDLSTGPGRCVVHVYRNGLIWGSYLIWQASLGMSDRGNLQARLSGATLESYLDRVEVREDLDFSDTDQVDIARALIESMQGQAGADLGITLAAGGSGVTRTVSYLAGESTSYGQRLNELSQLNDGFEWMIQTSDPGAGTRIREWVFGYPKIGETDTEHLFTQPGNVVSWQEDIDATRGATSFVARGESVNEDASSSGGPTLSVPHDAAAHFAAGWPRLDSTITAHFQRDTDTLDDYAARYAAQNAGAVRVHQVSIRLDGDDFTPAHLGDRARVVLVNQWWPRLNGAASFDQSWRVIGISVQATTRGQRETAQLVFEEVIDS
ncbi:hypothetical protein E1286_05250 [Nonomuraea terrae]|uniref:Minor tail protein n=1 Tax=Nonomuraea terrae TaxID=2530383 RepID=A0A4V2YNL2_9ACTN|nr:hypothetical protein [Nonomuraea terrae]TDD54597.1 hypothetical protein E1286_05250 [Nonomuraea terrae]